GRPPHRAASMTTLRNWFTFSWSALRLVPPETVSPIAASTKGNRFTCALIPKNRVAITGHLVVDGRVERGQSGLGDPATLGVTGGVNNDVPIGATFVAGWAGVMGVC